MQYIFDYSCTFTAYQMYNIHRKGKSQIENRKHIRELMCDLRTRIKCYSKIICERKNFRLVVGAWISPWCGKKALHFHEKSSAIPSKILHMHTPTRVTCSLNLVDTQSLWLDRLFGPNACAKLTQSRKMRTDIVYFVKTFSQSSLELRANICTTAENDRGIS